MYSSPSPAKDMRTGSARNVTGTTRPSFIIPMFKMMQGMIYAIEEVNSNLHLLPNITLGFSIYDSCDTIKRALEGTLWLLSGHGETIPNYLCQRKPPITAIIGESRSQVSIPMARILGLYMFPQVSYGSGALTLNDKRQFPSFLRSAASSYLKYSAVARMLLHFGWNWVGLLAEDDDYGQQVSQVLKDRFTRSGICLEFFEMLPVVGMEQRTGYLVETIQHSSSNVIVVTSSDSRLQPLMQELSSRGIAGKVWVGNEEWPDSLLFFKPEFLKILQGTIWFSVHTGEMPGFKDFLYRIHPTNVTGNHFTKIFWENVFSCKWLNSVNGNISDTKICTGNENLHDLNIPFFDVSNLGYTYNIYPAVYAVAHALHDLYSCQPGSGPFLNRTCVNVNTFEHWQLFHYQKNVHFANIMGEEIFFDETGNPPDAYDIFNWQVTVNTTVKFSKVGSFDSRAYDGHDLLIHDKDIMWHEKWMQIPTSVCSTSCSPGFRKASQRGRPVCCFVCIPCSKGEIANQTDSTECLSCPYDQWPTESRDKCIEKSVEFLSYNDPLGLALAFISSFSAVLPAAILIIFIKYHNTPVVKANNRDISYILLVGLMLCFLCSLVFIGHPTTGTCMIRQAAFGVIFVLCVSCVLAKTVMVVIAFNATKPNSNLKKWVGPKLPNSIVFVCTIVQIIICSVWLATSPPFLELNLKLQTGVIIVQCNEGSPTAFWCMLGYVGLLSSISFAVAFLSRNLPDSFNEAKFITFSMIVFVSVWLSFIPAYLSTQGKYMVAVEIFAIFSSSAGLLACIFFPKCYIILLRPTMNTKEYLMGKGIQNNKCI
ncbi:extracellular calcium-sensing receptor-like [Protopterus annectens]|uniref:extracellular calcium-sensing receptor-like n=1 Tax=Protopterus annectens TaxID=7888 RepID=UPI001CF943CE|nr:extracellular calcium-sensing receptor-like [Protopterus annectens]